MNHFRTYLLIKLLILGLTPVFAKTEGVVECSGSPREIKIKKCDNRKTDGECSNIQIQCQTRGKKKYKTYIKDNTPLKYLNVEVRDRYGKIVPVRIDNPQGKIEDYTGRKASRLLREKLKTKFLGEDDSVKLSPPGTNSDSDVLRRILRSGRYNVKLTGYGLDSNTPVFKDRLAQQSDGSLELLKRTKPAEPTRTTDCQYSGKPQIISYPVRGCLYKKTKGKICVGKVENCTYRQAGVQYDPPYVACTPVEKSDGSFECPSANKCLKEENYQLAKAFSFQESRTKQRESDGSIREGDR